MKHKVRNTPSYASRSIPDTAQWHNTQCTKLLDIKNITTHTHTRSSTPQNTAMHYIALRTTTQHISSQSAQHSTQDTTPHNNAQHISFLLRTSCCDVLGMLCIVQSDDAVYCRVL